MSPWTAPDIVTATDAMAVAYSSRRIRARRITDDTARLLTEIDDLIRPVDPELYEAIVGSVQSAVGALRSALTGTDPTDAEVAGLRRFLGDIERSRLPRSWDLVGLDAGRAPVLADRTCGVWPRACGERWYLDEAGVSRHYTCTRIASHTGRHAAGLTGAIVAVWEQDESEALGATGAAA